MPISFPTVKSAVKASIIQSSTMARTAASIDEALELQAEGIAEAIKVALETYTAQAKVNGGTCAPNGPIAMGVIS